MLNKTAKSNLKYIAIVIGLLMLLPFFNRITTAVEEYRGRGPRGTRRRRRSGKHHLARTPIKESARSKGRRKAKKCKYLSSPKAREEAGC